MICFFSGNIVIAQDKLVILHTNDTHSRIDPVPSTDKKYPDMGGVVNRKAVIDSIRNVEKNVILIDAGDFVQGTPYFTLFHGQVETTAMNMMGYEAGTIGNHEFDNGLENLKTMLDNLSYPIVNCNYIFDNTILKGRIKPYVIIKKNGIKVGVIGVGVNPEGLVQKDRIGEMVFNPYAESVNRYAAKLRKKCDVIICLSHIGYGEDIKMASQLRNVDVIIGGHTHTFMENVRYQEDLDGKEVLIYQADSRGVFLGKVELDLKKK
jgi:5'-nucleotidase